MSKSYYRKRGGKMAISDSITIVEVGPRDGLQYECKFFPTEKKIQLINLLSEAGLRRIEVTSFVHPKVIPQLRDAEQVLAKINKCENVIYSALVPNEKGCQRALKTNISEIVFFVSASEIHNQKNVGMSVSESLNKMKKVSRMILEAGKSIRGYIITAFGCPYEGSISLSRVRDIVNAYIDVGVSEISLGDTTGMANPRQVRAVVEALKEKVEGISLAVHFHNTRGTGLANALAAYEAGVSIFDSAVGGLGGCPAATVSSVNMGNICTEDLVNMMEEMGVSTGVNFNKLIAASALIKEILDMEPPSFTFKAGRPIWKKRN